jgi:hypothetical protein
MTTSGNASLNSNLTSGSSLTNYNGYVSVNGTLGTITPSTAGIWATNIYAHDTYKIQIGNYKMSITNYQNKTLIADSVSFSFKTTATGVKLDVTGNYETMSFNSLQELKEYIVRVKATYLKAKEMEKQLNIMGDFT